MTGRASAPARLSPLAHTLALVSLLLTGCPSTSPGDGGLDAGTDAPMLDGGGDAGPCGVCEAPTPLCDVMTGDCVACLNDGHCSGGTPACVMGSCEECDPGSGNEDCTAVAASRCDGTTNTCDGCGADADCGHLTATPVCDEARMTCVACTADDESACGTNVCDVELGTCTTVMERSAVVCEPCVSDRQCPDGQLCVPMLFPVLGGTEVGNFCVWRQDAAAGPMGDCTRVGARPYVRPLSVTSVSGTTATVCSLGVSSCEAHDDFRSSMITCTASGATPDPMCGADGFDDGFCRGGRCTVECTTNDDCPCTGITCARQYRCRMGVCEFDCECPTSGGACVGTCP